MTELKENQFLRGKTHIVGNYYLDADSYQHILVERGTGKTTVDGKEVEVEKDYILGYYPTIRQALEGVLKVESRKKVSSGACATVKELLAYLDDLSAQINAIPY
jgi:hypothetical protein